MALTKQDLEQIGEVVETKVTKVVEPYFNAIQKDFSDVYERFDKVDQRFDRLESLINDDYKQRIEKLEVQVKELRDALAS